MFEKLESLGAKKITDFYMKDNKGGNSDKIRYSFGFEEKEFALKAYWFFIKRDELMTKAKYGHGKKQQKPVDELGLDLTMKIYYQKDEDLFVQYGDAEAELYNNMEEIRKADEAKNKEKKDKLRKE